MSGTYSVARFERAAPSETEQGMRLSATRFDALVGGLAGAFGVHEGTGDDLRPIDRAPVAVDAIPLGRVSAVREDADRFSVVAVLARDRDHIEVASVDWPKVAFDTWWRSVRDTFTSRTEEPRRAYRIGAIAGDSAGSAQPGSAAAAAGGTDAWRPTSGIDLRVLALTVWTGSEMIVWGGWSDTSFAYTNSHTDGGRYDPATDTWRPISMIGAPSHRTLGPMPQPIWTGKEMIIWGGFDQISGDNYNDGARYDPATDTWTPMSTAGAPVPRDSFSIVWTGEEMIVWGGWNGHDEYKPWFLNSGGRYNPETDTWAPTSLTFAPEVRQHHVAVWTGTKMIVWGGSGRDPNGMSTDLNNGGIYDPQTDTWSPTGTSLVDAPTDRYYPTAVWTGTEMIIWGGRGGSAPLGSGGYDSAGGRYNPDTDTWTPTSTVNVPGKRKWHFAVWSGSEMLVWGGDGPGPDNHLGGRYNPVTDTWVTMNQNGQPPLSYWLTGVWTGSEMLVWGGTGRNDGRYSPTTDTWATMNTPVLSRLYTGPYGHSTVWTGSEMIIWGGRSRLGATLQNAGGVYLPATDAWRLTSTVGAPDPRYAHTAIWTGDDMIVWGGIGSATSGNTGARYNPATDAWTVTSLTASTPSKRGAHTAIWTGDEMIVWGGRNGSTSYGDGARYHPATDTWRPTSASGAPSVRSAHTAVWSGSRMIVWGGSATATGAQYDPVADAWQPTSTTGAPSARSAHTATWTGSEMVVWGGGSASGGRYDPAVDAWQPMSASGYPGGVIGHTAVWTGSEMIAWGGGEGNAGGRYDPGADLWRSMSIPRFLRGRSEHSAVWTGDSMLVFGGYPMTTTGATYTLGANLPPVARLTADRTSGGAPLTVTFDASTSSDPDSTDTVATHTFTFGDGSATVTQAGAAISHTYASAGTYTATLTVTDDRGLRSANTASVEIGVIPRAPAITTPAAGAVLGVTSVLIGGTSEPDLSIRVFEGAILLETVTADASGNFSVAHGFPDGSHTITATATDASGNVGPASAERTFTVDTVAPAAPAIGTPTQDATLTDSFVALGGTSEPRALVTLREGARVVATVSADATGQWSTAAGLGNGAHALTATATDVAGNIGAASDARTFDVADVVAPAAPTIATPAQSSTVEASLVVVSGTAEPGSTVRLLEGATVLGATPVNPAGAWRIVLAGLSAGPHSISAEATDPALNVGTRSAGRSFTVRAEAPPALRITSPAQGSIQPGAVGFSGTGATPGTAVTLAEGPVSFGTVMSAADGSWTMGLRLPTGAHTVVATSAGVTASEPVSFTVDADPPAVTITTAPRALFLPGAPARITGTASDNRGIAQVTVTYFDALNRQVAKQVANCSCASGSTQVGWTSEPSLPPGLYTAVAQAVDEAGNLSPVRSTQFVSL